MDCWAVEGEASWCGRVTGRLGQVDQSVGTTVHCGVLWAKVAHDLASFFCRKNSQHAPRLLHVPHSEVSYQHAKL